MCFALKILQEGQDGIVVVLESCGTNSTFIIHGAEAEFIGKGDLHDESYNELVLVEDIAAIQHEDENNQQCHHTLHIFPSDTLKSTYETNKPWQYTLIVVAIFVFSVLMFFVYDYYVANRQMKTEKKASKSSAIIQELFPGSVASQLFDKEKNGRENRKTESFGDFRSRVENEQSIAEFYPEATVLFADIAGKCNAEWRLKSTLVSMTNPLLICTVPAVLLMQDLRPGAPFASRSPSLCSWRTSFRALTASQKSMESSRLKQLAVCFSLVDRDSADR